MEIQGSNRELEALLTATVIAVSIIKSDESEPAEVDCNLLQKWMDLISGKLAETGEYKDDET